jgi:hypothetical protein
MLQRRSQHFSKRNRHVYAAERMQHTSVYKSSGVSFSRGRTAVSGYGACDVRAIGWSRVPVWVPSRGARPPPSTEGRIRGRDRRASTCLFVDCGMECHRLEKGRSTRPERAREDGLDSSVHRVARTGANTQQETTRVLTSQIYKCATLHASSSGCPAVQHSVEILDGERTDQEGHPDPH